MVLILTDSKDRPYHALTAEQSFRKLDSSDKGLSSQEAKHRLEKVGPNELKEEKKASKIKLLLEKIKNPIVVVLIFAALISLIIEHYYDALVIFIIVIFDLIIGFIQEFKAEAALQALKTMTAPEAEVIRDGEELRIKAKEIVPGDIFLLEAGDKVPADGRLLVGANLETDESMLTGESTPVRKSTEVLSEKLSVEDRSNSVFSGTIVTQGRGKALVTTTGMKTEIGKIADLLKETERAQTPIQKRTLDLGKKIGLFALFASILTFVFALLRGFEILETFLFVLAAAVSAIPQGLPIVVTVTLAIGVRRMAKRNAIIRKLQAVDTLGSATVICTDKTGTLTTNQMTARKILVDNRIVEVTGPGFNPQGDFKENDEKIAVKKDGALLGLLTTAVLCNDSRLRRHEIDSDSEPRWEIHGDPTEGALIVAAAKADLHKDKLEEVHPRIDEVPFNPKEKFMATFNSEKDGEVSVHLKGAPEVVLEMCSHDSNGEVLSEDKKAHILKVNTEMASEALRVLAIANQTIQKERVEGFKEKLKQKTQQFKFLGLIGIIDPPRREAKDAVALCKKAGIRVVMATGDQKLTAQAIAKEIGILQEDSRVVEGVELDAMTDQELDKVTASTSVFARVSPVHKHRIVESLRRGDQIVAMTGDGVNDAPALKAAEIGVAMGITGSDVTKETADMVLTDDNFASIVNAVEEGRVVFDNIRKVVKYLISTNAGEILTILGALILLPGIPLIFTPVQILWVNLVTDGLLDKFIAMEPKEKDVMSKPPRKTDAKIINRDIMFNTIFVGIFMAVGTLWIFTYALGTGDFIRAQTLAFTTIAMFQVFNAVNCRSRGESVFKIGLFTNKYLVIAILVSVALQFMVTVLPPMQFALGTTALSVFDWALIFAIASSVFIAEEIRKLIRKKLRAKRSSLL
jgi:P-type Ca2+ transporter type 2C